MDLGLGGRAINDRPPLSSLACVYARLLPGGEAGLGRYVFCLGWPVLILEQDQEQRPPILDGGPDDLQRDRASAIEAGLRVDAEARRHAHARSREGMDVWIEVGASGLLDMHGR